MGLRMMALTSWLDLLCKCKVKHVVCLLDNAELKRRYDGLAEGDLAATCRGQGLSFQSLGEDGFVLSKPPPARALAAAMASLRRLRPSAEEPTVIMCSDGRYVSAAVAAAWLSLGCLHDTAASVQAIEASGAEFGVGRAPLETFQTDRENAMEQFERLVLETSRLIAESPADGSRNLEPEAEPASWHRRCHACDAPEPAMLCSRCRAVYFCNAECQ